jgi:hypothetical protein
MTARLLFTQPDLLFLPPKGSKARRLALPFLALLPLLVGFLALYLGQDANWDFRNYHWYNAYAALNGRYGIDILPSQIPSFYNPLLDIPFYLLASAVPAKLAYFILATVQGLNIVLLFMLAHAVLIIPNPKNKVWVCLGLSSLGLLGGGGIALIGTTFYDNVTSLGFFASALLMIRNWDRFFALTTPRAVLLAFLCGLPAGLMMGLKLPFVTFCVGLCFAPLFIGGPLLRRFWISFGFGLGVLAALALSLGPWAWHLYTAYGNPLLPYFNNYFHSFMTTAESSRDIKFIPQEWDNRLLFPFVFARWPMRVGEIHWQDFRLPLLYVLLPLGLVLRLLFGRNKETADRIAHPYPARYILWAAVLSYASWLLAFAIYRYLIPLEMVAPLLLTLAIGLLPVRPQPRAMLTLFTLIAVIVSIQPGDWGRAKSWQATPAPIAVPALGETRDLMILMAGFEPYSHALPAFPPEIPFIRVQSNFSSPDEPKGVNQILRARVEAHKGRIKILIPSYQLWFAQNAGRHFNLTFLPQSCQAVRDDLYDSRLVLCDMKRP